MHAAGVFKPPHAFPPAANSTGAGQVTPSDDNTQIIGTSGTIQWITHTTAGTRNGTTGPQSFEFNWVGPGDAMSGMWISMWPQTPQTEHANNQGDFIYTTKQPLVLRPGQRRKPTIREANGVVSAADRAFGGSRRFLVNDLWREPASGNSRSWRA